MEQICRDWVPKNEWTCPLEGEPYYQNRGLIYALDQQGGRYLVSRIIYERFDEQNFQYVFLPEWSVIDALPAAVFQGIPGLDLSLRLEKYYRVNMTPVFISERTPGEGREDLWELLEMVDLDYYDRFEWLLRTGMRCGTDNLIVERDCETGKTIHYTTKAGKELLKDLQPEDCIVIDSLQKIADSSQGLRLRLLQILRSGCHVRLEREDAMLSDEERCAMLKILLAEEMLDARRRREHRQDGIAKAKKSGKYRGRKRIEVDEHLMQEIAEQFEKRNITEKDAMARLGVSSRSTFYRRLKEKRERT